MKRTTLRNAEAKSIVLKARYPNGNHEYLMERTTIAYHSSMQDALDYAQFLNDRLKG